MKPVFAMRVPNLSSFFVLAPLVLAACGGDPPRDPFIIQINSQDIVQLAVDQIEIVLEPSPAGTRFSPQNDMSNFDGTISSRVTGAGQFAIRVEQAYIERNARPGDLMNAFFVDVPILLVSSAGQESVEDPLTRVTFIRGAERIGTFQRFLDWPLADGGQAVFRVICTRPDFSRQCTNNDGAPPVDSGTMPDGGAGDGG
jgi:hypothetical protein